MKKWDFIKIVADKVGLPQQKVNEVVDEVGRQIVNQCRDNGEDVSLSTLGTFKLKQMDARIGRNPATGEQVEIKGSRTVQFRPMPSVKIVIETEKKKKSKK